MPSRRLGEQWEGKQQDPMVLKVRVSGLDIQQGHPLVLVATLPAMHHLWGRTTAGLRPLQERPCYYYSSVPMRAEGRTRLWFLG